MVTNPWRPTRRTVLKGIVATTAGLVVARAAYGAFDERHQIRLERMDLDIVGLPPALEGLRIGLITDVHSSAAVPDQDIRAAVELLREARVDMIALGGDYVTDFDVRRAAPVAELLAPLAGAPFGSFAVLGNHDDDRIVPAALTARGFTVLRDQRTRIEVRGESVDIAGLRYWTRSPKDVARVLHDTGPMTLMLAHDPRRLPDAAALNVRLLLAGHTHGGQVVLPGVGAIAARRFPVVAGPARDRDCTLYVSRGVGTVVVPIRINCPPEVSVLALRRRSAA